jgi:hypothetical protein
VKMDVSGTGEAPSIPAVLLVKVLAVKLSSADRREPGAVCANNRAIERWTGA